jgi:hypothetical protein
MNLDETIAKAKKASENQCVNDRCRENFKQLAEWLEELKRYKEENQPGKSDSYQRLETNLDHFKHEILENCLWNLAVVKGRPKRCDRINCIDCEFNKDRSKRCHEKAIKWLEQPYKAPAIKLTNFEIDLLQSCSQGYSPEYQFKNINSLTEMRKKGYFKGVDRDATLEDILANSEITEED